MTPPNYAHHFSLKNIPFGIASSKKHVTPQVVTRIENTVIFLNDLAQAGYFKEVNWTGVSDGVFAESTLNSFAALPKSITGAVRLIIQEVIGERGLASLPSESTEDVPTVTMHMPVEVRDFTDFSCSLYHNQNMGRIIMGDPIPPPGFFHFPGGYGGRAASITVSGTLVERPLGKYIDQNTQTAPGQPKPVVYGPCQMMDYELELAAVIGRPLPMQKRLKAVNADEHIFGFVILNDWSARDIQVLEMRPLGPLNSKNVGTTISPWVVTLEALEPFKTRGPPRLQPVVPYLHDPDEKTYDIEMQVEILPLGSSEGTVIGKVKVESLYWSSRQMTAHIVSAGSALRTGDIMATGTVSGPDEGTHGSLMEATKGGKIPVLLSEGEERIFLQDGDVVRMTAVAGGAGSGVGFGECVGELAAAKPFD